MSEERCCDVAIIGEGIAGLMTANRLVQLGTRAVVLEQGGEERYLCNTRIASPRRTGSLRPQAMTRNQGRSI